MARFNRGQRRNYAFCVSTKTILPAALAKSENMGDHGPGTVGRSSRGLSRRGGPSSPYTLFKKKKKKKKKKKVANFEKSVTKTAKKDLKCLKLLNTARYTPLHFRPYPLHLPPYPLHFRGNPLHFSSRSSLKKTVFEILKLRLGVYRGYVVENV